MASKAEWIIKIKSWIPSWFYEEKQIEAAVIGALAKVLADTDQSISDDVAQTFIEKALGGHLAMHGDERGLTKFSDEFDVDYRKRIRAAAVISNANIPALVDLLNKIVIRGHVSIKEDYEVGAYFNRNTFLNRGEISVTPILNTFTVVIDRQVHEPYSFFNRETFIGRGFIGGGFIGQVESSSKVFDLLIKTINENKAFGTLFRIVERTQ